MDTRDIIVIGGSSGATAPLKEILRGLPGDLPVAVFIVLHIPARSLGILLRFPVRRASCLCRPLKTACASNLAMSISPSRTIT